MDVNRKVALMIAGYSGMGVDAAHRLSADGFGATGSNRSMLVYLLNVIRPTPPVTLLMQGQGSGTVINISAFETAPLFPTPGVFRAGLAAFIKLYLDKYAVDNIWMISALFGLVESLPENEDHCTRILMGRYGRKEEVSSLIPSRASEGATDMICQKLRIDGGLTCSV